MKKLPRYCFDDDGVPFETDDERLGDWVRWDELAEHVLTFIPYPPAEDDFCPFCHNYLNAHDHEDWCLWERLRETRERNERKLP